SKNRINAARARRRAATAVPQPEHVFRLHNAHRLRHYFNSTGAGGTFYLVGVLTRKAAGPYSPAAFSFSTSASDVPTWCATAKRPPLSSTSTSGARGEGLGL